MEPNPPSRPRGSSLGGEETGESIGIKRGMADFRAVRPLNSKKARETVIPPDVMSAYRSTIESIERTIQNHNIRSIPYSASKYTDKKESQDPFAIPKFPQPRQMGLGAGLKDTEDLRQELFLARNELNSLRQEKKLLLSRIHVVERSHDDMEKRYQEQLIASTILRKQRSGESTKDLYLDDKIITKLKAALKSAEKQIKEKELEISQLKHSTRYRSLQKFEEEINRYYVEVVRLKRLLEHRETGTRLVDEDAEKLLGYDDAISELCLKLEKEQERSRDLTCQNDRLLAENERQQEVIQGHLERIQDLSSQHDDLKQNHEKLNQTHQELQTALTTLQNESNYLSSRLQTTSNDLADVTEKLASNRIELEESRKREDLLNQDFKVVTIELEGIRNQKEALEKVFKEQVDSDADEIRLLRDEISNLKERGDDLERLNEKQAKLMESRSSEYQEVLERNAGLAATVRAELAQTQQLLFESQNHNTKLTFEVAAAKDKNTAQDSCIEELRESTRTLENEVSKQKGICKILETQLSEKNDKIIELERKLVEQKMSSKETFGIDKPEVEVAFTNKLKKVSLIKQDSTAFELDSDIQRFLMHIRKLEEKLKKSKELNRSLRMTAESAGAEVEIQDESDSEVEIKMEVDGVILDRSQEIGSLSSAGSLKDISPSNQSEENAPVGGVFSRSTSPTEQIGDKEQNSLRKPPLISKSLDYVGTKTASGENMRYQPKFYSCDHVGRGRPPLKIPPKSPASVASSLAASRRPSSSISSHRSRRSSSSLRRSPSKRSEKRGVVQTVDFGGSERTSRNSSLESTASYSKSESSRIPFPDTVTFGSSRTLKDNQPYQTATSEVNEASSGDSNRGSMQMAQRTESRTGTTSNNFGSLEGIQAVEHGGVEPKMDSETSSQLSTSRTTIGHEASSKPSLSPRKEGEDENVAKISSLASSTPWNGNSISVVSGDDTGEKESDQKLSGRKEPATPEMMNLTETLENTTRQSRDSKHGIQQADGINPIGDTPFSAPATFGSFNEVSFVDASETSQDEEESLPFVDAAEVPVSTFELENHHVSVNRKSEIDEMRRTFETVASESQDESSANGPDKDFISRNFGSSPQVISSSLFIRNSESSSSIRSQTQSVFHEVPKTADSEPLTPNLSPAPENSGDRDVTLHPQNNSPDKDIGILAEVQSTVQLKDLDVKDSASDHDMEAFPVHEVDEREKIPVCSDVQNSINDRNDKAATIPSEKTNENVETTKESIPLDIGKSSSESVAAKSLISQSPNRIILESNRSLTSSSFSISDSSDSGSDSGSDEIPREAEVGSIKSDLLNEDNTKEAEKTAFPFKSDIPDRDHRTTAESASDALNISAASVPMEQRVTELEPPKDSEANEAALRAEILKDTKKPTPQHSEDSGSEDSNSTNGGTGSGGGRSRSTASAEGLDKDFYADSDSVYSGSTESANETEFW